MFFRSHQNKNGPASDLDPNGKLTRPCPSLSPVAKPRIFFTRAAPPRNASFWSPPRGLGKTSSFFDPPDIFRSEGDPRGTLSLAVLTWGWNLSRRGVVILLSCRGVKVWRAIKFPRSIWKFSLKLKSPDPLPSGAAGNTFSNSFQQTIRPMLTDFLLFVSSKLQFTTTSN